MKTGLLMSVAGVVGVMVVGGMAVGVMAVGAADAWAACIPTNDCAALGYKYSAADCSGEGLACPFDTTRYNCANPCTYTTTKSTCDSQCKNTSGSSCVRNGTTYYSGCGSSKCSNGQTCNNGTCVSPVAKDGYCCGYSGCSANETWCQNNYSKNCYRVCTENYGWPDCSDMQESCRATGGTPAFMDCVAYTFNGISVPRGITASFACH